MKNKLLFIIFLVCTCKSFAQKPTWKAIFLNPNVYRTMVDLEVIRISDKFGQPLDKTDTFKIKARKGLGLDYKLISEDENGYVVIRVLPKTILRHPNDTTNTIEFTNDSLDINDSLNAYNYMFVVKEDDFLPLSKTLLTTKIVGTPLVHPFKLRPSASNSGAKITTDFTVGYSFGLRLKMGKNPLKKNYFSVIPFGFGIGEAQYLYKKDDGTLSEEKDAAAITYYSLGIMFTLNKINVGLFNGYDAMLDKQNNWIYQGKPWFSFGFGYKFSED